MKRLHSLNKRLMGVMVFLQSPAGIVFSLMFAFAVDWVTNGLSVQYIFGKRISTSAGDVGLSSAVGFGVSAVFSLVCSAMLGFAAITASFHGLTSARNIISGFSGVISWAGCQLAFFTGAAPEFTAWYVFIFCVFQTIALSLAITPQLVYKYLGEKLEGDFGKEIREFIRIMNEKLRESFRAQMANLSAIDEKESEEEARELGVLKETKSKTTIADMMKELNIN